MTRYVLRGVVLLVVLAGLPAAAQNRAFFSDVTPADRTAFNGAAIGGGAEPAVLRSRRATADLSQLAQASAAGGLGAPSLAARSLALNLFADVDLIAQFDHVENVSTIGYAWVGTVAGEPGSRVVLAVSEGILTGSIELAGRLFSVRHAGDGYVIAEIDKSKIPGDEIVTMPADAQAEAAISTAAADAPDSYDLLLFYTTGVKNAAGGTAVVNSLITASIAKVNSIYAGSNISTRVRLVAAIETGYADTGDMSKDLPALRSSTSVRASRDQYGADIVSMLVTSDPKASGLGYISVVHAVANADYGYNTCVYYNFLGYIYALAHEIGHNQGSLHEAGNNGGDDTGGAYPYSLGYTDSAHKFYDVMSYGCSGCTQVDQFSSSVNRYQGFPMGSAAQDNVTSINNTRSMISNYRPSGGGVSLGTPTGMTASASGSTVTLSWTGPVTGTATSYIVEAGSAPTRTDLANFNTGTSRTSYVATGVGNGTYYVRTRATDGISTSSASNEATLIVGTGCSSAPAAPTGFTGVSSGGGRVTLTWNASAGATTYVIEAGLSAGSNALVPGSDLGGPATSYVAGGVGPGTYFVRLRAKNACGTSAVSNEVTVRVP